MCLSGSTAFGICPLIGLLLLFIYGKFICKLDFTIIPMTMESSLDVRDRHFSPTLDRKVTPDHHYADRRENNSNWCHYAKTKTRLGGYSLCLDHVIGQNVPTWSCIGPPNS